MRNHPGPRHATSRRGLIVARVGLVLLVLITVVFAVQHQRDRGNVGGVDTTVGATSNTATTEPLPTTSTEPTSTTVVPTTTAVVATSTTPAVVATASGSGVEPPGFVDSAVYRSNVVHGRDGLDYAVELLQGADAVPRVTVFTFSGGVWSQSAELAFPVVHRFDIDRGSPLRGAYLSGNRVPELVMIEGSGNHLPAMVLSMDGGAWHWLRGAYPTPPFGGGDGGPPPDFSVEVGRDFEKAFAELS